MAQDTRILIIDDDPAFAKSTKLVLESHGYEVDIARDGEEGLSKIEQQTPDMILLDVIMHWPLEGVDVSRELMTHKELRNTAIIMVTSIIESEYRDSFPQDEYLNIDAWLKKPLPPSELVDEVKRVLAHYQK